VEIDNDSNCGSFTVERPEKVFLLLIPNFQLLNHFDAFGDIVALYNSPAYTISHKEVMILQEGISWGSGTTALVVPEQNMILENNFYPNVLALSRTLLG